MELNAKYFFSFLAFVFIAFVFWPAKKSAPIQDTNESFEMFAKGAKMDDVEKSLQKEQRSVRPQIPIESIPQINQTSPSKSWTPLTEPLPGASLPASQPLTEKLIKEYEKADLVKILRNSQPIFAINSGVLASQSAYLVKTREGEVRIYSSMRRGSLTDQGGCVSIRDKTTIRGTFADFTMSLFKLPESDAFAAIIQKDTLLVYYGNTLTWGQENLADEPRMVIYYRKSRNGSWIFLGAGKEGLAVNSSPNQTEEEFCDMP